MTGLHRPGGGILDLDEDAVHAAADLVGRAGATRLEVGWLHDGVPVEDAAWYASAHYRGTRVIEENYPGPVEALTALARRLLTGAMCRCGRLVSLDDAGAVFYPGTRYADGSTRDEAQVRAAGLCRWTREGNRWYGACGAGR